MDVGKKYTRATAFPKAAAAWAEGASGSPRSPQRNSPSALRRKAGRALESIARTERAYRGTKDASARGASSLDPFSNVFGTSFDRSALVDISNISKPRDTRAVQPPHDADHSQEDPGRLFEYFGGVKASTKRALPINTTTPLSQQRDGDAAAIDALLRRKWDELKTNETMREAIVRRHLNPLLVSEKQMQTLERRHRGSYSSAAVVAEIRLAADVAAFHRHHISVHLSLLERERELVLCACDAVQRRERAIEELHILAVRYRHWATQHLLNQTSVVPSGKTVSLKNTESSMSATGHIAEVTRELHFILDRYRVATVEALEAVGAWSSFVASFSFFGSLEQPLPEGVASAEDPSREAQSHSETTFRSRETFVWRGRSFITTVLRDLYLHAFANEPIQYLVGTSLDWNPLALPGKRWNVFLLRMKETLDGLRTPTIDAERRPCAPSPRQKVATPPPATPSDLSLFRKGARDHRWSDRRPRYPRPTRCNVTSRSFR